MQSKVARRVRKCQVWCWASQGSQVLWETWPRRITKKLWDPWAAWEPKKPRQPWELWKVKALKTLGVLLALGALKDMRALKALGVQESLDSGGWGALKARRSWELWSPRSPGYSGSPGCTKNAVSRGTPWTSGTSRSAGSTDAPGKPVPLGALGNSRQP